MERLSLKFAHLILYADRMGNNKYRPKKYSNAVSLNRKICENYIVLIISILIVK